MPISSELAAIEIKVYAGCKKSFDKARILAASQFLLFNIVGRICSDAPIIQLWMEQMNQVAEMYEGFNKLAYMSASVHDHEKPKKD